ncbi:hypothetical protein ARMSODRAFT_1000472 [Armillaria solidipes]|uniref:DUF6534 domain-containing protein n=1 Tax=Armillaria solidipes TaxID=1076256 RepID=A0A2H3C092_9AGAR|nr:hypothetical protein ARMSODRAFT_1000472 [Armillaria solidipes]
MDLDSTYGSAFIGLIAASILYGATLTQTYIYFNRDGSNDWVYDRIAVAVLCILDTVHLILCIMTLYWHLITNFSNVSSLDHLTWSMNAQTGFNGLIALIVECIFARRVYIRAVFDDPVKHNAHSLPVSRNVFITTTIVLLSCFHFGLCIVFTLKSFRLGSMGEFQQLIWVTSAGNGSSAAADILIAASLCFYLSRNRTGHRKTDSLITTLIAYSLATGLVSSLIRVVIVITFAAMPNNYIWLAFCWIGGKCYVNSFLASLNCRDSLREKAARSSDTTSPQLSTFKAASAGTLHPPARALSKTPSRMPLMIDVRSSTITKTEGSAMTPIGSACSDVTSFSELV